MKYDGRELFQMFRFDDAVLAYKKQLSADSGDRMANIDGLGFALMAVGRYAEAIPYLSEAGEDSRRKISGSAGRDEAISVCEWLSNRRLTALSLMRDLILGLKKGSIHYAKDLVGGLGYGLLFQYMAVSAGSDGDIGLSAEFIGKLAKSKKAEKWPGPIGKFFIGVMTLEEALNLGVGTTNLDEASVVAASDLMKRRRLVNVVFNAAVFCRISKDEEKCAEYMRMCSRLQNPVIEYDWHLAKAEASAGGMRSS